MLRVLNRTLQLAGVMALVACAAPRESAPAPTPREPVREAPPKNDLTPPARPDPLPALETKAQATEAAAPEIDFSSAESAMAVLIYAMQAKDVSRLLECFAKGAAWHSVNTVENPWQRTKLTYDSLANGLKDGGEYRGFLFGDDGDDSFRNYFTGTNQGSWKAVRKERFEPLESSTEQPTYVQWLKQGNRYVVSEIAFPAD